MLVTEALTRIGDDLDEATPAAFSLERRRAWLNEAVRRVARLTLCNRDFATIPSLVGVNEYTTASNILQIDRCEWLPGDGRKFPMTAKVYEAMDIIWGYDQDTPTSDPRFYTTWGVPPLLKLKVYPTPDIVGSFKLFVARLPAAIPRGASGDGDPIDLPTGWDEVAIDYALYKAFRFDRLYDIANEHLQSFKDNIAEMQDMVSDYIGTPGEMIFDRDYYNDKWFLDW